MMEIKSLSYKVLLFRWIAVIFIFLNVFAFSDAISSASSIKLSRNATESKAIDKSVTGSRIFYKSFVSKLNRIYANHLSLKNVFRNLVIFKNSIVHVQFTANSLQVLYINFLIGVVAALRLLFYPAHQNSGYHTSA